MAAVSALLLVASLDHFARLPRRQEVVEQEVPQSGGVTTKTTMMEPQATRTERPAVAETRTRSAIRSPSQKIRNPKRHSPSPYESEADMVAQDTALRYGPSR